MSSSSDPVARGQVRLISRSERATLDLAESLGKALSPGAVIALCGDLGAGKTLFVRGLTRGLDTDETVPVCSPTFTLVNVYPGDCPVIHADLYRLSDEEELEAIGLGDYDYDSGVLVVEWADKIPTALPRDHLTIGLKVLSLTKRQIEARANGPESHAWLCRLRRAAKLARGISEVSPK